MKHSILVVAVLLAAASPVAAAPFALDYRAPDTSCIDAARFADEVSAKLGFVPWDTRAAATIRVRVERDGGQFTGSFRNADGTAKIVDGKTCGDVTATLVVTVATAVDETPRKVKAPVEPVGMVMEKAQPAQPADDKIPVTFTSPTGGRIDISLNTGGGVGRASNGTTVVANYFETVCTSPCTARLPRGRNYLRFQDPDANAASGGPFVFDQPTTLSLTPKSRHSTRVAAFIVGAALTGLGGFMLASGSDGSQLLGIVGLCLGPPLMAAPLYIPDTFATTQSP